MRRAPAFCLRRTYLCPRHEMLILMGMIDDVGAPRHIKEIERRVRASRAYASWVERNLAPACFRCDTDEDLEVHHIVELYHIVLGLWKLYGKMDATFEHVLAMHEDDRCEGVTLCRRCHKTKHPGRPTIRAVKKGSRPRPWTVAPRTLWAPFCHAYKGRPPNTVGLYDFQTLLGIGWYVLNGHMSERVLCLNSRRFAELIGKRPGTSFNRSFERAVGVLVRLGFLDGCHTNVSEVELHLGRRYLKALDENPWFFSLDEIKTARMSVLTLRWMLSTHMDVYRATREKLVERLGMGVHTPAWVEKTMKESVAHVEGTSLVVKGDVYTFRMARQAPVPVHTLRQVLRDSLNE